MASLLDVIPTTTTGGSLHLLALVLTYLLTRHRRSDVLNLRRRDLHLAGVNGHLKVRGFGQLKVRTLRLLSPT